MSTAGGGCNSALVIHLSAVSYLSVLGDRQWSLQQRLAKWHDGDSTTSSVRSLVRLRATSRRHLQGNLASSPPSKACHLRCDHGSMLSTDDLDAWGSAASLQALPHPLQLAASRPQRNPAKSRTLPSRSKRHRRWQNRDIPQSPLGTLEELHYLITERLLASVTGRPRKKDRPRIVVAPPLVRLL